MSVEEKRKKEIKDIEGYEKKYGGEQSALVLLFSVASGTYMDRLLAMMKEKPW